MRKKLISILLLLLIPLFFISAVDGDQTEDGNLEQEAKLTIKGYKIGVEDYANVIITDAITESLSVIGDEGELDVTNHVQELLGTISSSDTSSNTANSDNFYSEQVVFSYRVAGNTPGNYSIELVFSDLVHEKIENSTIKAEYDLGNLSYSFADIASSQYTENGITYTIAAPSDTTTKNIKTAVPSEGKKQIISYWNVSATDTSLGTVPVWIHRGAVAMTISTDYSSSGGTLPVGTYRATVEVTLVTP